MLDTDKERINELEGIFKEITPTASEERGKKNGNVMERLQNKENIERLR